MTGAWHYVVESLFSMYKVLNSIFNSMKTMFLLSLKDKHEMQ